MKKMYEILYNIDKDALVEGIMSNGCANSSDKEQSRKSVMASLNDLAHIAPVVKDNPHILWPLVLDGCNEVNVIRVYNQSIFGKYSIVTKIECEPLIEHLAGREKTETKKERLASFLGMHVNTNNVDEKDLLPFVAKIISEIIRNDLEIVDYQNYNVPKDKKSQLTRRRNANFDMFFDMCSPHLARGFDGHWEYSTSGLSCACSWTWKEETTGCNKSIKGKRYSGGMLVALDAPPRCVNERWEWLCQCQIHDVPPKYLRITKLENGEIKGCGCHGGSMRKNNSDLIGEQIGCVEVLNETRINGNRPENKVRCIVCGREKWVRVENLRKHIGIRCYCIPTLNDRIIAPYYVLDAKERKNNEGLPELLCEKENGEKVWIQAEKLIRILAKDLAAKKQNK